MLAFSRWQTTLLLCVAVLSLSCAATASPTPLAYPTSAPSPTRTASPTPSPTPIPAERLASADRLLANGQYAEAITEYGSLLAARIPEAVQEQALLGLGTAYFQAKYYQQAIETLQRFLASYPASASLSRALVTLAQAQENLSQWTLAAEAYARALPLEPDLKAYLYSRIGHARLQAGDDDAAVDAYALAAQADAPLSVRVSALEDMGDALRRLGRYNEAIAAYNAILKEASNVSYRASINYKIGLAEHESGQADKAAKRWLDIVESHANTWAAYASLQELAATDARLPDDLTAGIVCYHAQRYDEALAAFRRYIQADPKGHLGTAHYYAGMSHFYRGEYEKALRELNHLIETHPLNKLVAQGWLAKARTQAAMGQVEDAVHTYRRFAALYPDHRQAEDALWQAAALTSDCAEAQKIYREIVRAFPNSARAAEARLRDGLCAYTARSWTQAIAIWQQALPNAPTSSEKARLLFWLGKAALEIGARDSAETYWAAAIAADPTSYYGRRAENELHGSPWVGTSLENLLSPSFYQRRGQREEAEAWLTSWVGPVEDSWSKLPSDIAEGSAFRRAEALLRVGLRDEAMEEYRAVLASVWEQPQALYSLALYFDQQELYRLSTSATERLLQLAPVDQTAPRFLLELAHPTPFADLVLPGVAAVGVDPMLFYALMRQESRFDPQAKSYAGAIGLTQIMPSTGEWIAWQLGDKDFVTSDLYRPVINVNYGLYYLAAALRMFEDDPFRALVAYNAGPSNAQRWAEGIVPFDRDLFYEQLPEEQPQAFVREIYRQYTVYRMLYGPEPTARNGYNCASRFARLLPKEMTP